MVKHRSDRKGYKQDRPLYTKMNDLGIINFYIELIEECPCDNLKQLRKREGHFIREICTLNKIVAGRSDKEYREDNTDRLRELRQIWENDNAESLKEKSKEYYQQNKDSLSDKWKIYREEHQDRIKERKEQMFTCECGISLQENSKYKHIRSKFHQNYFKTMVSIHVC